MKKKDIWISLAIVVACGLSILFYMQREGFVGIDSGDASAELHIRSGLFNSMIITSDKEQVAIGARIYRPQYLSLSMETNRFKWRIESRGPWGDLSKIKVKNNEATALKLGPPFLIKPIVRKNGSLLYINYAIIGQAGEQYRNFITKNNRAVTGAKIKIVDKTGNVLESGNFMYG